MTSDNLHKTLLFGALFGASPEQLNRYYQEATSDISNRLWAILPSTKRTTMTKWKQRKSRSLVKARNRKIRRGRHSGITNNDTYQSKLMDKGVMLWYELLNRIKVHE